MKPGQGVKPSAPAPGEPLLSIEHLRVSFGETLAVDDVSLTIGRGERGALVGESGSGKSVTALVILRLLRDAEQGGSIRFDGRELGALGERAMRGLRGSEIAMIFQEPMTALNPLYTVGDQIVETIVPHDGVSKREARRQLSAPALRRPAPARHYRDGAGLPAAPAAGRRADHRARRDDPRADRRAAAGPAARCRAHARHVDPADHARPEPGAPLRAARGGDGEGAAGGERRGGADLRRTGAPLIRASC